MRPHGPHVHNRSGHLVADHVRSDGLGEKERPAIELVVPAVAAPPALKKRFWSNDPSGVDQRMDRVTLTYFLGQRLDRIPISEIDTHRLNRSGQFALSRAKLFFVRADDNDRIALGEQPPALFRLNLL